MSRVDAQPRSVAGIPFSAIFNFRDLGGYAGLRRPHRALAAAVPLRLAAPASTSADREAFAALGIRTVIDLRRPYEVERDGRVPDVRRAGLPAHPPRAPRSGPSRRTAERRRWPATWPTATWTWPSGAAGLAAALGLIADAASAPVVVHCVAGKDRTGVVCALTLSLLGVADEDIAADYALSTEAASALTAWLLRGAPGRPRGARPARSPRPPRRCCCSWPSCASGHGSVEGYVRPSASPTPSSPPCAPTCSSRASAGPLDADGAAGSRGPGAPSRTGPSARPRWMSTRDWRSARGDRARCRRRRW